MDNTNIKRKRVLLTGGTTGTGRRLARRLLEADASTSVELLRCLIHTPGRETLLPVEDERVEIAHGSLDDPDFLRRVTSNVDTVVHLAGHRFTPRLAGELSEQGRGVRFVAQSSTRLFSRYSTPTRESVRRAEEAVEALPVERVAWTILRPSMIFGGTEDRNIERLSEALERRRGPFFPIFGSGRCLRQPMFVRDLVAAHEACLRRPESIGRSYTLACAESLTFRELVEMVARLTGARAPIFVSLPRGASLLAARALKRIWPGSPLNPEMIERFGEDMAFDISEARRDLGFNPTPLEEALAIKFGDGA